MNWLDLILFAPHFLVGCCYGGRQKIILGLSRSTNYITMSMGWRTDKILANYSCQLCRQKTEGLVSLLMRGFSRGQTAIPPSPPVQLSSPPLLLSLRCSVCCSHQLSPRLRLIKSEKKQTRKSHVLSEAF